MNLLPFQRKFCVHHTAMHQFIMSLYSKLHRQGVYVCLSVTCHLHFWQNDWDLLGNTVKTQGWVGQSLCPCRCPRVKLGSVVCLSLHGIWSHLNTINMQSNYHATTPWIVQLLAFFTKTSVSQCIICTFSEWNLIFFFGQDLPWISFKGKTSWITIFDIE